MSFLHIHVKPALPSFLRFRHSCASVIPAKAGIQKTFSSLDDINVCFGIKKMENLEKELKNHIAKIIGKGLLKGSSNE